MSRHTATSPLGGWALVFVLVVSCPVFASPGVPPSGYVARAWEPLVDGGAGPLAPTAARKVVGGSTTASDDFHAFISSHTRPPNSMADLGALGDTGSYAYGINDSGQVVGDAYTPGNSASHACLSSVFGGTMQDLNSSVTGTGWAPQETYATDGAGQIAGNRTIDGQTHASEPTPCAIPEPDALSIILCGPGLAAWQFRRRRRRTARRP